MIRAKSNLSPEFTIIVAVFNAAKSIESTLCSILNQTYKDYELIVIDGGSKDGTIDVIQKYEKKIAYWVSEPDEGIYDAWNKGISKSRGQWIAYLGAGDEYNKDALMTYSQFISDSPRANFDYISSKVALTFRGTVLKIFGIKWKWPQFKSAMLVAHVGSIHHTSLYERFGVYDKSYKIVGDYEFLLRPRDQLRAGFINVVTANMSAGGLSDSYGALAEAAKAKLNSGGGNILTVVLQASFAHFKLFARRLMKKCSSPVND